MMDLHIVSVGRIRMLVATILLFAGGMSLFAQENTWDQRPLPMKHEPAGAKSGRWHSIHVAPKAGAEKIHFYNKLNPVWWFGNIDEPLPPEWYRPADKHRTVKWYCRNPFHNFDFYVLGVADKNFVRSGRYPERNSNPNGGWNFAVARCRLRPLPFVSYERSWITFYLGWREHGAFGAEMKFHHQPRPKTAETK